MNALPSRLLIVTDRHQARHPVEAVIADVVKSGARWIWLRGRDLEADARRDLARRLFDIVHRAGGQLSIGDDIALAIEIGCAAIHVRSVVDVASARRWLGSGALIGASAHSETDAIAARAAGADYVTLSPIYATSSKPGYGPALGLGPIAAASRAGVPVMALGGMDVGRVGAVRNAGAHGVAVMGIIMRADAPGLAAGEILAAMHVSS